MGPYNGSLNKYNDFVCLETKVATWFNLAWSDMVVIHFKKAVNFIIQPWHCQGKQ